MREALKVAMKPELPKAKLPAVPDLKKFQLPPVLPGNNCNGNDRAISIDIDSSGGGLEITICTFLDFELEGELSADGLLAELEESISLELDAGYVLKGVSFLCLTRSITRQIYELTFVCFRHCLQASRLLLHPSRKCR